MKKSLLTIAILLTPSLAFAFPGDLRGVTGLFFTSFDIVFPILNNLAFLLFFWGIAKFVLASGSEKAIEEGKQFMIWGVVAIFVLVSFWGIIKFMSAQFGVSSTGKFPILPV